MQKIMVIDYSGHPFQVQLSRSLAAVGHEVQHLFTASSETPKGDLAKNSSDPDNFAVESVQLDEKFNKTNFLKRWQQERQIGRLFQDAIERFSPDLIIAANCPIETLRFVFQARSHVGARLVFWLQDMLGEATGKVLRQKLGLAGSLVGRYYENLEQNFLKSADQIVAISEDFLPVLVDRYGCEKNRISIIENWSPIDDLPVLDRDNDWAQANVMPADFRIVYSGTLGFKQDPELLLELASRIDCQLLVFSEGVVADKLAADARKRNISNLFVRDWLPFEDLPNALASADLLVVLLEADAGRFCVPSKVLTYLCSARPILGSINGDNLAARIINREAAGTTFPPGQHDKLVDAATVFRNNPDRAKAAGLAGRKYAEHAFGINMITSRFLDVIAKANA